MTRRAGIIVEELRVQGREGSVINHTVTAWQTPQPLINAGLSLTPVLHSEG